MAEEGSGQQSSESPKRAGRRTSIPCPKCGARKSVGVANDANDSRVWRRRECAQCKERFSTYEIPAADYKNLRRVVSIEAQGARAQLAAEGRVAEIERVLADLNEKKAALMRVFELINKEQAEAEQERQWQRENPTEALKAIFAPKVFDYLNDWARREKRTLTELIVRQIALDIGIDIDMRIDDGDLLVGYWAERLKGHVPA